MLLRKTSFLAGLYLAFLAPVSAQPVQSVHTTVELISESSEVAPGETFHLGVVFDMEPEWHIYWVNAGASGLAPELEWDLPAGFSVGEIQWPAPERFSSFGLVSYGYKGRTTLVVPVQAPEALQPGTEIPIKLALSYLICKDVCLPGDASLELDLKAGAVSVPSGQQKAFERARKRQPSVDVPFTFTAVAQKEKTLLVDIAGEVLPKTLYFYAEGESLIDANADQPYRVVEGVGHLTLPLDFAYFEKGKPEMKGILQSEGQSWHVVIPSYSDTEDTAVAPARADSAAVPELSSSGGLEQQLLDLGILGWLALAFVGGLILNIMPCVLPVLSLKVFSLLNHSGQSRSHALAHGIAYTAGVVASFLVLAGVLFSLRALGESIGWGFQLQNPGFVLVLGLVMFLFGLNLLGVFEFGGGLVGADAKIAGRKDLFGSFGVGVLAAIVGAPCVGPFLGSVAGLAVQADTFTGLLVFAVLGFGMAFPFLLLAIFPKFVAYLPKPGPWMESFKQSMGFLLMATLVFLVYLIGELEGSFAMTVMLLVVLCSSVAAWIYGRWGAAVKSAKQKRVAGAVSLMLILSSTTLGLRYVDYSGEDSWAPWSREAVESALDEGKPVLVDFTATWCLICQVNKRVALRTDESEALYLEKGIVTLSADWTSRDGRITEELEKFGRSGVPLYVLYEPDGQVSVLPQNLTNGIIRDALEAL